MSEMVNLSQEQRAIVEATEKWNLVVEVYSEECGCCFQEQIQGV